MPSRYRVKYGSGLACLFHIQKLDLVVFVSGADLSLERQLNMGHVCSDESRLSMHSQEGVQCCIQ